MKKKRILLKIALLLASLMFMITGKTHADVGSFESYDTGSFYSSEDSYSGKESSYSSYSSSEGSSYSSSSHGENSSYEGTFYVFEGLLIGILIIGTLIHYYTNGKKLSSTKTYRTVDRTPTINWNIYEKNETNIENKIRETDEAFSKEKFKAWSKNLFVKLQQAWSNRDWESIRQYETLELYEQHKTQLQGYIDNNQINIMERICVNRACLQNYRKDGDKEILTVLLNSRMADYIIDATSKKVLRGDKYTEYVNNYLLTFVRTIGAKTGDESDTQRCPNCGAPISIQSLGECEYCHSAIVIQEREWTLANLERYNGN